MSDLSHVGDDRVGEHKGGGEEKNLDHRRLPISRNRIETLSDLVFGLTLSIGALALIAGPPTGLDEMNTRIISFIFNFTILMAVWLRYTIIMSMMPVESGVVVFSNVLLLLLITLEPYLLNGIQFRQPPLPIPVNTVLGAYSSQLYAIDLSCVLGILAAFTHILSKEEKHLIPQELLGRVKLSRNALLFFALLFLVTALPQFWDWRIMGAPIRLIAWFVPLVGTMYMNAKPFENLKKQKKK